MPFLKAFVQRDTKKTHSGFELYSSHLVLKTLTIIPLIVLYIYIYILSSIDRLFLRHLLLFHLLFYIYIYIYIYICCHPQTGCFVVSQLFSVARHVGRLKLGSTPVQLYVRLSIRPHGQQAYHVGKGIIRYYITTAVASFVCLHFIPYRIPECSIRSKSFAL